MDSLFSARSSMLILGSVTIPVLIGSGVELDLAWLIVTNIGMLAHCYNVGLLGFACGE
jgi:hypothetical protein